MNAESNLITVPLSRLQLSPRNVRKTGGATIEDLAASIAAHTLQQNLVVTRDAGDMYAVEAGGRRLKALQLLASEGKMPNDWPVPCKVVSVEQAAEISLAENQLREQMHPADQFTAIKALVDSGLDEAEVAARFGVTRLFVRQRMKLAKVSPKIIADYRAGKTTLEIVEACALTDDISRQERAYKSNGRWANGIRRDLTKGEIESTDPRAKFIGLEAYEAAGGPTHKDLFDEDGTCYLRDAALLDRLVAEKLDAEAEKLRAEGWGWVEAAPDIDVWRYQQKEAKGDKAKCGALVTIGYGGKLEVHRWRLKQGQRASSSAVTAGKPKDKAALSADMVIRLELHRAAAIREHVAADPKKALQLLLLEMVTRTGFTTRGGGLHIESSLHMASEHARDGGVARGKFDDLLKSTPRANLQERVEKWQAAILGDKQKSTADKVLALSAEQQLELLALCFALTLQRNGGKSGAELADLLGVDMTKSWTPTVDTFLGVVAKPVLAAAVAEVAGKSAGEQLLTMKKDAAIAAAAKHLDGKGWLPKPLRGGGYALKGALAEAPKTVSKKPAKKSAATARKPAAKKTPAKKATTKAAKKAAKK